MLIHSGVFQLHEFFSIFMKYDEKLSRPIRFCVFYLKILLILAISGLFSQQMNEYQALLLSILSTIIVNIPLIILQILLRSSFFLLKSLGAILTIASILVSLYAILTVAALMGKDESTKWAINYVTSYISSQFFIVPISTFFKLLLANKYIMRQLTSNKCTSSITKLIVGGQVWANIQKIYESG